MLDPARLQGASLSMSPAATSPAASRAVFKMVESDRMAGSVPAWLPPDSAILQMKHATAQAVPGENARPFSPAAASLSDDAEPFGFGDLIDIINPLQHIPLVNTLYRILTGDQIRPSSNILGGAVFGGFAGMAGGFANAILQEETGKDIAGNVFDLAMRDDPPGSSATDDALPGAALSFVDMSYREDSPAPASVPQRRQWKFNE